MFSASAIRSGSERQLPFVRDGQWRRDHHEPLAGFYELEDDLEDVARGVAQMHDVRVLLDHAQLAVVVGQRCVDSAQVRRSSGSLDDLQMRVADRVEQRWKTASPSTSHTPNSSGPWPPCNSLIAPARLTSLAA